MTPVVAELVLFMALCATGIALALILERRHAPLLVAWFGVLASLALIALGIDTLFNPPVAMTLWQIPSLGAVLLRADALAGLFLLISGLVFLPGSISAANSLPSLVGRYNVRAYAVMHFVLLASIGWVLLAGDVFSFLVAWEIMSILCYLLVNFEHEAELTRKASRVSCSPTIFA
jgi:hydrogenase-4 component B